MKNNKMEIYSKPCFDCIYETEAMILKQWAVREGLAVRYYRTEYNPIYHRKAQAYRKEYRAFIVVNGKDWDIKEAANMIKENQGNELLGLPQAKDTTRKDSLELEKVETEPTVKKSKKRARKVTKE